MLSVKGLLDSRTFDTLILCNLIIFFLLASLKLHSNSENHSSLIDKHSSMQTTHWLPLK